MSSAQRSRVLSPVVEILTPSSFALRTSGFPFGVAAGMGVTDVDCLRTRRRASNSNREPPPQRRTGWFAIDGRFGARGGFGLVDVVFPLFDDLFGEVGDVFGLVGAQLSDGETRLALLRNVARDHA